MHSSLLKSIKTHVPIVTNMVETGIGGKKISARLWWKKEQNTFGEYVSRPTCPQSYIHYVYIAVYLIYIPRAVVVQS